MNNTFAKLRKQKKVVECKLNTVTRAYKLVCDENERLKSALNIEQKVTNRLSARLEAECKHKYRINKKLIDCKDSRDLFYTSYIETSINSNERLKNKNIIIGLSVAANAVLIGYIAIGLIL